METNTPDYLTALFIEEAAKLNIPLEDYLQQVLASLDVMQAPVPENDRLRYVEEHLHARTINPGQADLLLRENPVLKHDIPQVIADIEETMGNQFGLEIPDNYQIIFDDKLNQPRLLTELVFPIEREIRFSPENGIYVAVLVSHALGHVYYNENSILMDELRVSCESDHEAFAQGLAKAAPLVEGWAVFFSWLYVQKRDEEKGINLHTQLEEDLRGIVGLNNKLIYGTFENAYETGFQLYKQVYDRFGFMGALWAAQNFTTVEELQRFAYDESATFTA